MTVLQNKIDFSVVFTVKKANPNGDPLNGNRPRQDFMGHGEVSDVALKRKIRNRLQDEGESIFVQSDERRTDGYRSLKDRAESVGELKKLLNDTKGDEDIAATLACQQWLDVRAFGQVFAFKDNKLSIGVRGPVSIHTATSLDPVDVASMQITKSVNSTTNKKNPGEKTPDTMGMKHRVDFGVYVFHGSINPQLAEKTGFTEADAEKIRQALITLFVNDASSARPDGSMEVNKVFWWKHASRIGQYSSAKIHRALKINKQAEQVHSINDYDISIETLEGLACEVYDGL
ncbi:type I-C CRISPR-associated protein Cas7/Csd2 [Shouchella clausii]|uniref:type I-C CRISPR-associated protein Cas7/Csd2 n=1 Tax=Shouchella TaxID=2893057 RepID=UPI001B0E2C5D|nr:MULTISPECIES: type I-C CRISPR-associated protein Cas7/Csd2 [Shouchella]MCM3378859.1 type I-C CRISPR-associated protein Cas7/Csd2 [Shouchella rhizosphaerae]GIN18526.1 type I-C CRISPR-associated protein Cas7/Csd2 [Shouchella clausii]